MWLVSVAIGYDEELGPLHEMYGSVEAAFEFQRTIKRAELTAFLCLLVSKNWTHQSACRQQGIIDELWRGERKCINPKAGDADLWTEIWEELRNLAAGDILVEVEHVKAHSTKKKNKVV